MSSRQTPIVRRAKVTFNNQIHSLICDADKDIGSLRTAVAHEVGLNDLDSSKYRIYYYGQIVADETPLSSVEYDRFELLPVFGDSASSSKAVAASLKNENNKRPRGTRSGGGASSSAANAATSSGSAGIISNALHNAAVGNSAGSVLESLKLESQNNDDNDEDEKMAGGGLPRKMDKKEKGTKAGKSTTTTASAPIASSSLEAVGEDEICLPIVVGTMAKWRGKDAPEGKTHEWKCYVRGLHNQDLDEVVDKVTFELHHTFAKPFREVVHSPFEMSEIGWGEFEIQVHIKLRHCDQFVTIPQLLTFENRPRRKHALPPTGAALAEAVAPNPPFKLQPVPVINEKIDTIVIRNPSTKLRAGLGLFAHMQSASKHRGVSCRDEILQHYRKLVQSDILCSAARLRTVTDESDIVKYLELEEEQQVEYLETVLAELKEHSEALDTQIDAALLKQSIASKGVSRIPRYNFA